MDELIQFLLMRHLLQNANANRGYNCHCDVCKKDIDDYRYKCLDCYDYDLCSTCFEKRKCDKDHESSHIMARFNRPGELFGVKVTASDLHLDAFEEKFKNEVHSNHQCSNCKQSPIIGLRLKCDECADFNLCLNCRHSHFSNHPLIAYGKIETFEIDPSDVTYLTKLVPSPLGFKTQVKYKNETCECRIISSSKIKSSGMDYDALVASIKRELLSNSEINSQNVLRMIGCCQIKQGASESFMVLTESTERGSLEDLLQVEPDLTYKQRFLIACDIASGLARIHSINLIHRDLRPANIYIGKNYAAKIGPANEKETSKCSAEKRWYMPPEFESGQYEDSLDIYSFGLTLNQLFGGEHEYDGKTIKITKQASVVWNFVQACTNSDPEKRPSAGTIIERLQFLATKMKESADMKASLLKETSSEKFVRVVKTSRDDVDQLFKIELQEADASFEQFEKEEDQKRTDEARESKLKYFLNSLNMWNQTYLKIEGSMDAIDQLLHVGDAYFDMSDLENTLKFYEQCYEKRKAFYNTDDHLEISNCLGAIGNAYLYIAEEPVKALEYHGQALSMRHRLLGPDAVHPKIVASLNNKGRCLLKQAKYSEDLECFLQSLDVARKYYGPDSYLLIIELEKVKECYVKMNDRENIIACERETWRLKMSLFESKYPGNTFGQHVAVSRADGKKVAWDCVFITDEEKYLGFVDIEMDKEGAKAVASDLGEIVKSDVEQDRVESIQDKWELEFPLDDDLRIPGLPPRCPKATGPVFRYLYSHLKYTHQMYNHTANTETIMYLKELHYYFYDLKEAHNCQLYTSQFLQMCQDLFGAQDHILTSDALFCMSRCCELTEKYAEGIEYAKQAFEMRKQLLQDPDHPKLSACMYRLGLYSMKRSEFPVAVDFFLRFFQMSHNYWAKNTQMMLRSLLHVFDCYEKLNDVEKCLFYRNQILRIRREFFKQKHPDKEYKDVFLMNGSENGCPTWAYVRVDDDQKYQKLLGQNLNFAVIQTFGCIVKSGPGLNPPAKTIKEIAEEYFW